MAMSVADDAERYLKRRRELGGRWVLTILCQRIYIPQK